MVDKIEIDMIDEIIEQVAFHYGKEYADRLKSYYDNIRGCPFFNFAMLTNNWRKRHHLPMSRKIKIGV